MTTSAGRIISFVTAFVGCCCCFWNIAIADSFVLFGSTKLVTSFNNLNNRQPRQQRQHVSPFLLSSCYHHISNQQRKQRRSALTILYSNENNVIRGDPIRDATGIRPSLHPVTINAISEILKLRAKTRLSNNNNQDSADTINSDVSSSSTVLLLSETQSPLQKALTGSTVAADAIAKRRKSSRTDGMTLTMTEEQTIAGRVVGVTMRLSDLEIMLDTKCSNVSWIEKYNEYDTFGIIPSNDNTEEIIDEKILSEPLFCLNRAECLLGLFLHQIEIPQLQQKNTTVPDNSIIDFLDSDKRTVLCS